MKDIIPLSVIVPVYNRLKLTRRLLNSFVASTGRFEVIIVDDASSEPIKDLVNTYIDKINIKFIRMSKNIGPAAARNLGIKAAKYEYVAFTDNDCIVDSNWAKLLYINLLSASKNVAGIGGRVLSTRNDIFGSYYTYHKILDPYYFKGTCMYLVTANCCYRRKLLLQVGGFDEQIKAPGGEDPGLAFKLRALGYEFNYFPEAIVFHHYRPSILDFIKTFIRYGKGCRLQVEKYFYSPSKSLYQSNNEDTKKWKTNGRANFGTNLV